jgi:energy-coupling factor transport system ATP-binding protein
MALPQPAAWAVRGLDLDVAAGERVLVLGASGSGKSTLLAGLAGLLDPGAPGRDGTGEQEGELLLDGVPARAAREQAVLRGTRRTGLLLQDPQAQTVLARCGDDVAFGLENHAVPPEEIWPRVAGGDARRRAGVPAGHPTSRLSGGERQRLALAGVLALRPGLLLLDEPTAMLDPDGARRCASRSPRCWPGRGRRACWSSTGSRTGSRWSTGWSCSSRAAARSPTGRSRR